MNTAFETTNSKSRVLIVDDNSRFARGAQLFLEHTGNYFACAVNDPRRALETARSFKPDLVVVDLIMPKGRRPRSSVATRSGLGAARSADRFHNDADHTGRSARWSSHQRPSCRTKADTRFRSNQSYRGEFASLLGCVRGLAKH